MERFGEWSEEEEELKELDTRGRENESEKQLICNNRGREDKNDMDMTSKGINGETTSTENMRRILKINDTDGIANIWQKLEKIGNEDEGKETYIYIWITEFEDDVNCEETGGGWQGS